MNTDEYESQMVARFDLGEEFFGRKKVVFLIDKLFEKPQSRIVQNELKNEYLGVNLVLIWYSKKQNPNSH